MNVKHLRTLTAAVVLLAMNDSQALEVHEWGTFTSLVNEKGVVMKGMHHEEEGLPGFVYGLRAGGTESLHSVAKLKSSSNHCGVRNTKCAFLTAEDQDVLPYNQFNTPVTQKMETPVIYFYGNEGEKAHVEVKFPDGMISQWFPAASSNNLHLEEFKNGYMSWDVSLGKVTDTENFPKTRAESIWNPARATKANAIRVENGEEERFIFYRGLGDFTVPLKISLKDVSEKVTEVSVTNSSNVSVPALFYLRSEKTTGVLSYLALPALAPGEEKTFLTSSTSAADVKSEIKDSLVKAGLFEDEALSMLNTWDKSYFHTTGERLLYILPTSWTEKILPLSVTPAPSKLVRVLIGRIELFSQRAQKAYVKPKNDHLGEAKLNAVKLSTR